MKEREMIGGEGKKHKTRTSDFLLLAQRRIQEHQGQQ